MTRLFTLFASVWLFVTFCLTGMCFAQVPAETFDKGVVIPRVVTRADDAQSYALYVPKSCDPARPSAVIFVFEPAARGPLPVSLMKDAAEKFGFIVIASNNSRNGPFGPEMQAAEAMWKDAHDRFTLDPKRTYFAGFSGGSRLAVMFTARCKGCAAGAVASGAAFPMGMEPKSTPKFLYFGSVGREDFNFPEYLQLEPKLKSAGFTYHLRRFDGAHEWAPADVWLEAFAWFNLQAMKSGALPKEDKFITDAYSHALTNAAAQGNDLEKFRVYSQIVTDFAGLTDTSSVQKLATEYGALKTVKDQAKREAQQADDQRRLAAPISEQLEALKDADQRATAMLELRKLFAELKAKAQDNKDPQQMVAKRVRTLEFVHAYENGMEMITSRDYSNALLLYDVIISNAIAAPGAHLQKSKIYLLMGDQSKALAEARLAVKDGVNDPANFSEPEFAPLKSNPEFQALLASLHPNKVE